MSKIYASKIINGIAKNKINKTLVNQRKLSRIINSFLDKAKDEALNGSEIILPGKMGSLVIEKKVQNKPAPLSRIATLKEGKATHAFDPRTMGYYYQIKVNSENLDHCGIVFKAGSDLRSRLHAKVIGGFKNYKMA